MTSETGGRFKRWFWRPPRPHGEVITDRQVSVLELFYDLVYVAVIGQAAHHLAEHVTVRGVAEFAVVFADVTTPAGTSWLLAGAVATGLLALVLTEQGWSTPSACRWCSTPFVWRCPQARLRPCWSAGCDRRPGSWRCCW
jgi:Bacterial low temperature requirement A protein (LtrA)